MNFTAPKPDADAKEDRRQGEQAFTMVEIAIAIGVIGFALVAIIGILPRGMNMQRNDRQDTAIAEDGRYFIDAIRNGVTMSNNFGFSHALDFLTNYIVSLTAYGVTNGVVTSNLIYTSANQNLFTPGAQIVGLLSAPNTMFYDSNHYSFTRAVVRALNSPATEQSGNSSLTAFTYQMDVYILPYDKFAVDATNFLAYPTGSGDYLLRYNRWLETSTNLAPFGTTISGLGALTYNLFDVRVHFRWPVFNLQDTSGKSPSYSIGDGYQDYRTMIGSQIVATNVGPGNTLWWFFQPQSFTNQTPSGLTL